MIKKEIDEAIEVLLEVKHDDLIASPEYISGNCSYACDIAIHCIKQVAQLEDAKGELPERLTVSQCKNSDWCGGSNEMLDEVTPIYLKVVAERDALKAKLDLLNDNKEVC